MARHILAELGHGRLTAELLTPNELVSGMLLQVGRGCGGRLEDTCKARWATPGGWKLSMALVLALLLAW